MKLLIVEDSYLVILNLEAMCEDLDWTIVGPATRLAEALSLARTETFDAALLDVNLDGEMSWDVATILKGRGIPFAFSTGYDEASILPDELAGSHIFAKPYRIADVEQRLRSMVAAATSMARV
ncbi:MAG: response regulator [Alphaproteobacteria bacterium]|nr:response regulator [Alphaproteobacteria bacterium]